VIFIRLQTICGRIMVWHSRCHRPRRLCTFSFRDLTLVLVANKVGKSANCDN